MILRCTLNKVVCKDECPCVKIHISKLKVRVIQLHSCSLSSAYILNIYLMKSIS